MYNTDMLFSRLDLSQTCFSEALACLKSGDKEIALEKIIEHFKRRNKPVYLFSEKDIIETNHDEIIEEADRVCRHEIFGYNLGTDIDWRVNATFRSSMDSEWLWSLARHIFWQPLARAYAITGDEKYAREFASQLMGFVKSWPVDEFLGKIGIYGEKTNKSFPGDAWRTLEAAIRIYAVWIPVMIYFRKSPSLDNEFWVCFLNSLHDHAEFLCMHYSNHYRCSNWASAECTALFQIGVLFPEFKKSNAWKLLGYRRVTHEVRYQFDHYGVHIERTPIYHLVAAIAFLQAYRIAKLNDIPVPPYMFPILEKTAEYLMRIVKPDFTLPMIGDADRNSLLNIKSDESLYEGMNITTDPYDLNEIRAFFRVMSELTDRQDFLYFCTRGEKGAPPVGKCFYMPDQGFYVFRTGWRQTDSYFMVTGVQLERGERNAHSHYDAGHLELQIKGEDILIDTGRYLYINCNMKEWREYFISACAHNTLLVDNHKMGSVPNTSEDIRCVRTFCHQFKSTPDFDLVEVSHNGYAFLEEPVFHMRRVIHFKPGVWLVDDIITGIGKHEYRLYFNFAPGILKKANDNSIEYDFITNEVNVKIVPLYKNKLSAEVKIGDTNPIGGWVSYGYAKKTPAPQLIFTRIGGTPVRFLTAIIYNGTVNFDEHALNNEESTTLIVRTGDNKIKTRLGLSACEINQIK
jgi:hypothetical protein